MAVVKVDGLKKVQNIISQLPKRVERKVITQAMKASAKPMVKRMKAEAPRESGELRRSIGTKVVPKRRTDEGVFILDIGPRIGRKFEGGYYAHIVELGGKTTQRKPDPFIRRAFRSTDTKMIAEFRDEALRRVDKQLKKL